MKINKWEIFILPIILFSFFVNYHYYRFYEDDFKKVFNYITPSLSANQYNQIQELHPYQFIYKLSQSLQDPDKSLIYVRSKHKPGNSEYLDELNIMIDYFFYPHVITPYTPKEFVKTDIPVGTTIISDINLKSWKPKERKLQPIFVENKKFKRINRWPEEPYYIYKVE